MTTTLTQATGAESRYVLGWSDAEQDRLIRQAMLLEPLTEGLFRDAGIARGQRVLDIGSGVGDVAMLAARLVGPSGDVVGIERDADYIARARERVAAAGFRNVTFVQGDVTDIVIDGRFNAAVGRMILSFLPDPVAVLRSLVRRVVSGGVVAFHEVSWAPALAVGARLPLCSRLEAAIYETGARSGVNMETGFDLRAFFEDAGLPAPRMHLDLPLTTDASFGELKTDLLRAILPAAEAHGVSVAGAREPRHASRPDPCRTLGGEVGDRVFRDGGRVVAQSGVIVVEKGRFADAALEASTIRRVSLRLLPLLFVLYVCNFVDRTNVAIAALHMNRDLGFSATVYGLGTGIFFLGYSLCEVPSNLVLVRVGARRWIARIMVTWGLIASTMMLVRTPAQFYVVRFLLGVAEAGFFPGIVYYLSLWFPAPERARALSRFMIAIPFAATVGNPIGVWLLKLDGSLALRGWQWLFLLEGIPSVLLGLAVLALLTDGPEKARWLPVLQRTWLVERLARDEDESAAPHGLPPLRVLGQSSVWLLALPWLLLNTTLYGYTFWAPTIIRDSLHSSDVATGFITGAIACLSAAGMLAAGASVDRRAMHCFHAAAGCALAALGYAGAAFLPTPPGRIAALALAYVGGMSVLSSIWCLPSMLWRGSAAAAAIAFVNSVGNIGGFAGPVFIGWMQDATGSTRGAFLGLAVTALLAAVFYVAQRRRAVFVRAVRAGQLLVRPGAPNAPAAP